MSTKAYMIVLVIIAKSVIIKPEQKESLLQSKESFHIISKRIQESFKCQCEECDQQARTNINLNKKTKSVLMNEKCFRLQTGNLNLKNE